MKARFLFVMKLEQMIMAVEQGWPKLRENDLE